MAANRALARSSELAIKQWAVHEIYLGSDDQLQVLHFYRTKDFLYERTIILRGYKQLLEVQRAFRTFKSTFCLQQVYHSKDDRIRSHILICWLAFRMAHIAEVQIGMT